MVKSFRLSEIVASGITVDIRLIALSAHSMLWATPLDVHRSH